MTQRVVVFGGRGFIGSAICRTLGSVVEAPPRSVADLSKESQLRRVIGMHDIVINAAGWAAATDRSPAGLARLQRDNVEGPANLATVAAAAGAAQLIHLSSVAAIPDRRRPMSPYARSKFASEQALWQLPERPPLTVLRATSVFGEGRGLARALCRIASLPVIPVPGGGSALIPFTHVDNVAHAVRLAIDNSACLNRTFIVGDAHSYTLRSLIEGLARVLGRRHPRLVSVPVGVTRAIARAEAVTARLHHRPPLLDEQRINTLTESAVYSIEAFQEATGYEPAVSLEEALQRLGQWCRAERR